MKNRFILFFFILSLPLFWSCEEENEVTWGDFDLPSELEVVSITDSVGGYDYQFANPEPTDTTFIYHRLEKDSVFFEDGSLDSIRTDTIFYEGKTAKLYTIPQVLLPKYKNRLFIQLKSNARWTAPVIPFRTQLGAWIKNKMVAGVGDAIIEYEIGPRSKNPNSTISKRRKVKTQYYTTADSTIMYEINFSQKSMIEE